MPVEIIPPGTKIDFIGRRRIAALLSLALIVASLIAIPLRGIRLGIDFAGGTEAQVRFEQGVTADEGRIRSIVSGMPGVEDLSVVRFGDASENEFLLKFRENAAEGGEAGLDALRGAEEGFTGDLEEPEAAAGDAVEGVDAGTSEEHGDRVIAIEKALERDIGPLLVQRVEFVGPRVGAELRTDGALSLLWASLAILFYITVRFSSRFAPGAIVAVIHDLMVTAGIFVILGMDFDLRILAAMLAILGYSLNDTIIIYDRIRENMAIRTAYDLPEVLNESVNQTLSRTILTSGTTLVTLLCLFFLGGEMIRPFAFAMLIGVLVGTYSSIYIAAPVLLLLHQRFGGGGGAATPVVAGAEEFGLPSERFPEPDPSPQPARPQRQRGSSRRKGKGKAKKRRR